MRFIVLGGAGDVGSRAVEELASDPGSTLVTIADRNAEAATALQARVLRVTREQREKAGAPPCDVRVAIVDAFDHAAMVAAIRGHDVCASALGPFHLFEVRCAKASIDAGVGYCSVCDDWNAAAAALDELDEPARRAGVVVITGFGATPGTSNMGVKYLASTMDLATDVEISCYQPLNAGGGEAVLRHMLFVMSGTLPIWRDGRRQLVRACGTSKKVKFPKYGDVTVWPMGHAEPVTMHRFMPTLRNVEYRMGFGFGSRLLVIPAYFGLFKFAFAITLIVHFFYWLDRLVMKRWPKGSGSLRVDVYGLRNGQRCQATLCAFAEMRESTGMSLAVGALMMATGEGIAVPVRPATDAAASDAGHATVSMVPQAAASPTGKSAAARGPGGAFAPEGCVDPVIFLRRMLSRGSFRAYRDVNMTIPFTAESLAGDS